MKAKRIAGRRRLQAGLYIVSALIVMLLTLTLWDAPLNVWQIIGLVACVALLYLLGMMQGMLMALAMGE